MIFNHWEIWSQNNIKNLNINFRFFSFFTRDGWFFALCQWSLWVQWDWGAFSIQPVIASDSEVVSLKPSLRTKWSNPDCNQISLLNTWIATASPRDDWLSLKTIVRLRDLGIQPPLSQSGISPYQGRIDIFER